MADSNQFYETAQIIGPYWDQLWRQLSATEEPALWDVHPSLAVEKDYALFSDTFNPELPIIDVGSGSGIQTQFLGTKYDKIFGIDASKKAIAQARALNKSSNIFFEKVNLLNDKSVQDFHKEVGDANIYMRGVLHQIPFSDRLTFVDNLKYLLGNTGALYLVETSTDISDYIQSLASKFSELPISLKRVLTSNFPPFGVALGEINTWFDAQDFKILSHGTTSFNTNIKLDNFVNVELPGVYALIKKIE